MSHLTRVKTRIRLHAHRKVRGLLDGEYASTQVGRSMDFNDLREYIRGDDVKDIDWKASARTRSLLIKRYAAVRKHTVLLVVSTGRSMAALNDLNTSKRDLSVLVSGVVGYLTVKHGDAVSLVYGDAEHQGHLPPAGGELNLEERLAAIHDHTRADGPPSDLTAVLSFVAKRIRRRTIMLVVSDEYAVDEEMAALLRRLAVQHEVLFCSIGDFDPTKAVAQQLVDVDSGSRVPSWARRDRKLHDQYAALVREEQQQMRRTLDGLTIVHERVHDEESAIRAVFRLLERHRHARRR